MPERGRRSPSAAPAGGPRTLGQVDRTAGDHDVVGSLFPSGASAAGHVGDAQQHLAQVALDVVGLSGDCRPRRAPRRRLSAIAARPRRRHRRRAAAGRPASTARSPAGAGRRAARVRSRCSRVELAGGVELLEQLGLRPPGHGRPHARPGPSGGGGRRSWPSKLLAPPGRRSSIDLGDLGRSRSPPAGRRRRRSGHRGGSTAACGTTMTAPMAATMAATQRGGVHTARVGVRAVLAMRWPSAPPRRPPTSSAPARLAVGGGVGRPRAGWR